MDYKKYQKSRDLSWSILIRHGIAQLPVKVSDICRANQIKVTSYKSGYEFIKDCGLVHNTVNSDGFTFGKIIFYNEQCSIPRQRFTVAHELGHILLHNGQSVYNREPSEKDIPIEAEANVFASRILAPACVLWGIGVTSAKQISEICNISMQSAEFRFKRLSELYEREKQFMQEYNKSCFLMSPLERAVYNQFLDYINKHKL